MGSSLPIPIGLNGRFFPNNWRAAREEIAFARAHGFNILQIRGPEEGLGERHLGETLEDVAEKLRAADLIATIEMLIGVDASGHTVNGGTPLDVLEANLPAIAALSCPYVHWHLVPLERMNETTNRQLEGRLGPQFMQAVTWAGKQGFVFGFEHNEPELRLFSTPESCRTLLEDIPNLRFVWDVNHTTPKHLAGFRALIPHVSVIHVSDAPLPEVNHHLPLGLGNIDFLSYCHALLKGGFHGPGILEIGGQPKSGGFGRDTDAALVDSRQRLGRAIREAYLRCATRPEGQV